MGIKSNGDIMLSIYVPVYNHEKYIVQCLESILMQKTQYEYEVLIGEDASTDNTREILKDYEKNLPTNFKIFYREKNMHKLRVHNSYDLRLRCEGKYIIGLEGDDFWIDENKIEKQITFLENNPDYIAVAHNCKMVDAKSHSLGIKYPECTDEEYTWWHYAKNILPGQLATFMSRNYMIDERINKDLIFNGVGPGDRRIYFTLLCYGKFRCMQEVLSAYRYVTNEGSSYSATYKYKYSDREASMIKMVEFAKKINNREAILYSQMLYIKESFHAFRMDYINFNKLRTSLKLIDNIIYILYILIKIRLVKKS